MKRSNHTYFVFVIGVLGTLFGDMIFWENFQADMSRQHQLRAHNEFIAARDMLQQHSIRMSALRSFFKASNDVSEVDFTVFAKDLLNIESAVVFTLNSNLDPKYISDTDFLETVSEGRIETDFYGDSFYFVKGFYAITMRLNDPENPYLIYALFDDKLQSEIEQHSDICEEFTLGNRNFSNQVCQRYDQRYLSSLFRYHLEDVIELPEYDIRYHLSVDYMPTKADLVKIGVQLLLLTFFGLVFSLIISLVVKQRIDKDQHNIESNSKLALLSTLNHEIRTPINAVLGYANMLKAEDDCSLSGKQIIDKIIWSANLLNSVAQNTLTYSKALSGTLDLYYEEINFPQFMHRIDDYYHAFINTHNKQFIMKLVGEIPDYIELDETKFFQLVTNFINNSFKYSTGDSVILSIKMQPLSIPLILNGSTDTKSIDGYIRVAVKDFGKGMSKASIDAITRPFSTDISSSRALKSGIGIGLYTCKKVIESVGGRIRIRSRKDNGTLVIFQFPYKQSNRKMAEDISVNEQHHPVVFGKNIPRNNEVMADSHPSELRKSIIGLTNRYVLLVDDNYFNLEVCKSMLESEGYQVFTAKNEQESLKVLNSYYDSKISVAENASLIVLMDYMLDDTDGLSLISSLKELGFIKAEYFILSANSRDEIPKAEDFPDIQFLQKPLNIKEFRYAVDNKK